MHYYVIEICVYIYFFKNYNFSNRNNIKIYFKFCIVKFYIIFQVLSLAVTKHKKIVLGN